MKNFFTMILQSLINKPKDKSLPREKNGAKSSNKKRDTVILKKVEVAGQLGDPSF